jgi:hypothetical protein
VSKNRENVVWQSENGLWSIGFYTVLHPGNAWEDDDYDDEWDVDYDFDSFEWGNSGFSTVEAAMRSWNGPNPGGTTQISWREQNAEEIARLNEMLWAFKNPALALEKRQKAFRKGLLAQARRLSQEHANTPVNTVSTYVVTIDNPEFMSRTQYVTRLVLKRAWYGFESGGNFVKVKHKDNGKVALGVFELRSLPQPYSTRW